MRKDKKLRKEYKFGEVINGMTFLKEDFHELEVTGRQRNRMGIFKCHCGEKILCKIYSITSGSTKSCGCIRNGKNTARSKKHGMYNTVEYAAWESMKSRCYNIKSAGYKDYGGRGIVVCEEWKNSFSVFYKDMGDKPEKNYSLERLDVNGNYEKSNCKWGTKEEQDRNRRNNIYIHYKGETKILKDWERKTGIPQQTIRKRMIKNLPLEEVFNPDYKYTKKYEYLPQI